LSRLPVASPAKFSLKLFGGVSISTEGVPLTGPAAQRRRLALLSVLAAAPEAGVSREKLIGYFWPDTDSNQARRFLADSVYTLRKALGKEAIVAHGDTLRLDPARIRSDVGEFRDAVARGDRRAVVALYQGPFLDGFFVPDAPELERWADVERAHFARDVALALEALAEEREREADLRGAVDWWRQLAAHDPCNSHVALRLMRALEAAGDRGGALQHARVHEALLWDTLQVASSAEVGALVAYLRSPGDSPAPPAPAGPPPAGAPPERLAPPAAGPDSAAPVATTRSSAESAWVPRPRRGMAWAAAAVLLVGVVGTAVLVRGAPALEDRRVFVAIFDNQTGDPALDPLGRMAADWIARGLLQTESLEVVSAPTILEGEADGGIRTLARGAGAGTMVSGAYYLEGGVLRLQAQITDMMRGTLFQTLEPLSVPVDSATAGVELLRQEVAAALAARFDWSQELREITTRSQPPIYAAYEAYVEGIELFGLNPQHAIERFDRAWEMDTSFFPARLFSILAHTQFGELAVADSMIRDLAPHREALSPFERAFLDRSQADLTGDREAALRAARRMTEFAPGSQFILGHAAQAIWANRPREAVDALRQLDPKLGLIPVHARADFLTTARHMLGEHRRELNEAREFRIRHPSLSTVLWEVRALAALGRVPEVERLLHHTLSLPPQPGWTPADVMRGAAVELRAHGHADAAARAFEQALSWYASRPAEAGLPHRWSLARTLYEAERWPEARAVFEGLAVEWPEDVHVLGHLGTLAARSAQRDEAERISAALAASTQPYLRGSHTLWRARISAQLGQSERARHLLREALAQGQPHGLWLHTDQDLELSANPRR